MFFRRVKCRRTTLNPLGRIVVYAQARIDAFAEGGQNLLPEQRQQPVDKAHLILILFDLRGLGCRYGGGRNDELHELYLGVLVAHEAFGNIVAFVVARHHIVYLRFDRSGHRLDLGRQCLDSAIETGSAAAALAAALWASAPAACSCKYAGTYAEEYATEYAVIKLVKAF